MKVVYDPCEAPREKKRGAGASVSSAKAVEESAAKRTKKSETGSSDSHAVKVVLSKASRHSGAAKEIGDKPPRVPGSKSAKRKNKGIWSSGHSLRIAKDMGSEAFMSELCATESNVPLHSHRGERIHLYLDQFGSFYGEPDSVGSVLMKVQSRARAPLRTVNLLDEEDDDEVPEAPPKIFPMGRGDLSPKRAAREEELEKETCGAQKKREGNLRSRGGCWLSSRGGDRSGRFSMYWV